MKREQILVASVQTIGQYGLENSPISKIAKRAGVGAGTIYRYFETKEELIVQLFIYLTEEMAKTCLIDNKESLSIREWFNSIWGNVYRYMRENPEHLCLMEQLVASPAINEQVREEALNKIHHEVDTLLNQAKAKNLVKDLDNHLLAIITFGSLVNIAKKAKLDPRLQIDPQTLLDICWDAVRA